MIRNLINDQSLIALRLYPCKLSALSHDALFYGYQISQNEAIFAIGISLWKLFKVSSRKLSFTDQQFLLTQTTCWQSIVWATEES